MAVLASFGYRPALREPLVGTGVATVVGAPFGGHAVNLAAITAALVAGPDAHPDPGRRWIASVTAGATYVALGLGAGLITAFASLSPPLLLEAVAGLALLRTLGNALADSLAAPAGREAAVITFVVAASGITVAGIGAPFWALVAGIAVAVAQRRTARA
jgi:benzoate membrane transport protein